MSQSAVSLNVLATAWKQQKGNKIVILLSFILLAVSWKLLNDLNMACLNIPGIIESMNAGFADGAAGKLDLRFFLTEIGWERLLLSEVIFLVSCFVILPLLAGCYWMGIKISRQEPVRFREILFPYTKTGSLWLAYAYFIIWPHLAMLLLCVPATTNGLSITAWLLISIVAGIKVFLRFFLVSCLILDKNLPVKQALRLSKEMVKKKRFKLFMLKALFFIILFLSFIIWIPLIWAVPTIYVAGGMIYNRLLEETESSCKNLSQ